MRRLLAIFAFAFAVAAHGQILAPLLAGSTSAAPAPPSWTLKNAQSGNCSSVATCATSAFTNALTNPSIIVVGIEDNTTGATGPYSVTDTAGHTFVSQGPGTVNFNSNSKFTQLFCAANTSTTASNIVTMAPTSGTMSFPRVVAAEFSGASSCTLDGGLNAGYSSLGSTLGGPGANALSSTSLTTSTNGDLIISLYGTISANITAGTSPNAFTLVIAGTGGLGMEYFVQTTAGAIQPTAGDTATNDTYNNITLALK